MWALLLPYALGHWNASEEETLLPSAGERKARRSKLAYMIEQEEEAQYTHGKRQEKPGMKIVRSKIYGGSCSNSE